MLGLEASRRRSLLVRWRHGGDAKRDAKLVFQAASEGRPLELAKRLRLGVLAGGLTRRGDVRAADGRRLRVDALGAAELGGHDDCALLILQALGRGR